VYAVVGIILLRKVNSTMPLTLRACWHGSRANSPLMKQMARLIQALFALNLRFLDSRGKSTPKFTIVKTLALTVQVRMDQPRNCTPEKLNLRRVALYLSLVSCTSAQ
jgi:hypothetical protein